MKSKKGFAFGLAGVILGAVGTFIGYAVIALVTIGLSIGKNDLGANLLTIFLLINIASIVIAIIGICLNFKYPKISAIIMIVSAVLYSTVYIYIACLGELKINFLFIILELIPAILFVISSITNLKKQKQNSNY